MTEKASEHFGVSRNTTGASFCAVRPAFSPLLPRQLVFQFGGLVTAVFARMEYLGSHPFSYVGGIGQCPDVGPGAIVVALVWHSF